VDELFLLANPDARLGGTGVIGNRALSTSGCDVVGLVHADTVFEQGALDAFARAAAAGAIAGVVGRALDGRYIWSKDVTEPVNVSTLDSCSVFVPRGRGLRFDDTSFDGFHCCVEDLCLTAAVAGLPVVVPPAAAHHVGESTGRAEWQMAYWQYRKKLQQKWCAVSFATT
jgi:hypothetical protein